MSKPKKSGSAIFMYCVIALCLTVATVCFVAYYGNFYRNGMVLWVGIVTFTVLYHFWLRIIMGNVTKLFKIHYSHPWFKELAFERRLYKFLQVKRWKGKALTYDPQAFSLKKHTLDEIANTMAKAETDHWVNELISVTTVFFAIPWGYWWLFLGTAVLAMLFDAQFIVIQRYNRPTVLKLIEKQQKRAARHAAAARV